MKTANELKQELITKKAELEKYQKEGNTPEAVKLARIVNSIADEYEIVAAQEKTDFEKLIQNSTPLGQTVLGDKRKLSNRAFNKMVFRRGTLTDEERRAYNDTTGQIERTDSESVGSKGGYLVPEEQIKTLHEYRKKYTQLKNYCRIVQANSNSGKYPTLGEETGVLVNFTELEDIQESDFEFGQAKYEIQDYGDIIPISNQLVQDSDLKIMSIVGQRLARKAVNTENVLITSKLNTLTATTISDWKALNKALIKDLDPVYWSNAKIYTNQDGFLWMSNLVDGQQRPLLIPDVTAPNTYRYKGKEVVVIPNSTLPNGTNSIPFYVGNMADYLMFFERQGVEIAVSTEVFFAKYGTALRCVVRFGATVADKDAMIALKVAV